MVKPSLILRPVYLQWLLARLFPRLRQWPVCDWPALIDRAQATDFDRFERLGIVAALVLTTWLLRPAADAGGSAPLAFVSQLLMSVPWLLLLAGPFFLRRIRRVLDREASAMPGDNGARPKEGN